MSFFSKHYHSPGTSPGTLIERLPAPESPARVRLVSYDHDAITAVTADESVPASPADAPQGGVRWLHVQGRASHRLLRQLGETCHLHSLALEDVHNGGQRPKVEEFDEQIFVILALPRFADGRVEIFQTSFFLATDFVLSFCEGPVDPFEPILRRLQEPGGRLRNRGSDYLLYALIDTVIDQGFPVLEAFGQELEQVEETILARPTPETLPNIHVVRRELILLRRMLWPHREVLYSLVRDERDLIHEQTRVFLRDCADHTIQVMELVETYRDMTASMLDIYLSGASNRMNETIRILTVIATIFMPLTFLVGVYGMNFASQSESPWAMPELSWYYGYPILWLVMILIGGGMMLYFMRRRWL